MNNCLSDKALIVLCILAIIAICYINQESKKEKYEPVEQKDEYKNLEYFITYMSNGLEINGPGSRK